MKIEELKDFIVSLFGKESSLLILGPPGIGKSTGVDEGAKKIAKLKKKEFVNYDDSLAKNILAKPEKYFVLVDLRLTEVEPADLTGIPKEQYEGISYKPFLWALVLSKTEGILFLDEFTNVQRLDVISASYKLILEHRAGFTKFHKNLMVVAAGNSPGESSVSNLLPAPLVDRFTMIETECPTIEAWAEWMDKNFDNWDRGVLAYLKHFPDEFLRLPSESEILENFPSPRSWTSLATLLISVPPSYQKAIIEGRLGPETGQKFFTFLGLEIPSVEEIISCPKEFENLNLDQKYLISVLVGNYLRKNIEKDNKIEKTIPLLRTMQGEFLVLSIISSGPQKREVALKLIRKDKKLTAFLEKVSILRIETEINK